MFIMYGHLAGQSQGFSRWRVQSEELRAIPDYHNANRSPPVILFSTAWVEHRGDIDDIAWFANDLSWIVRIYCILFRDCGRPDLRVIYVDQLPDADFAGKLNDCIGRLPSSGGVCD